jgi:hypothetical protein
MKVGGDGDKSDVKTLDGTNYQQWAPKMQAYLKSKELCKWCKKPSIMYRSTSRTGPSRRINYC